MGERQERGPGEAVERAGEDADQERRAEHAADEAEADAERRQRDLGHEDDQQLARLEGALDGGEAQGFLADAQHLRNRQREQAERQARHHRLRRLGQGQAPGLPAAPQQRRHEADGDQRAQQPLQREQHELVGVRHALEAHQEQRRPLEDDVGQHVARRRRDRHRREGAQRVVPQDHLVGEHQARDRRVERGRDRRRDAAGQRDRLQVAHAEIDPARQRAQHGAQVDHRPVLPDRGAGPQRQQGGARGGQAAAQRGRPAARLHGVDRVGRRQAAALAHAVAHQQTDQQAAQRRHQHRGHRDQQRLGLVLDAGVGGDQQAMVEPTDGLDEADRRQRGGGAHAHAEQRQHQDAVEGAAVEFGHAGATRWWCAGRERA